MQTSQILRSLNNRIPTRYLPRTNPLIKSGSKKSKDPVIVDGFQQYFDTERRPLSQFQEYNFIGRSSAVELEYYQNRPNSVQIQVKDESHLELTDSQLMADFRFQTNQGLEVRSTHQKKKLVIQEKQDKQVYVEKPYIKEKEKVECFIVRANHIFKVVWDFFIIIIAIYNCFSIPLQISFDPPILQTIPFIVLDNFADVFFVLDIVIAFRTSYINLETGDEVLSSRLTAQAYFNSNFAIDFFSTVPIATIVEILTRSKNPQLKLFSLLKLVRVTRLGRMIARLNVNSIIKNYLQLFQIVFIIILYMHCQACSWNYMVDQYQEWSPPLESVDPDSHYYAEDTQLIKRYYIAFYYSICLITGNDIGPVKSQEIFFTALAILLGQFVNANLFGNMALLLSDMDRKTAEFQSVIDTSNTAMNHLKLPHSLRQNIIAYLNMIKIDKENQTELQTFLEVISPVHKEEVIRYLFAKCLQQNFLFKYCKDFNEALLGGFNLELSSPEQVVIQQGDAGENFYFIQKGDYKVFVKSQDAIEGFVRNLYPGMYFGEVSILRNISRTATISARGYCILGRVTQQFFKELLIEFPAIRKRMMDQIDFYQDRYKSWIKSLLYNVSFLKNINFVAMDYLINQVKIQEFDEQTVVVKNGETMNKIYILIDGEVETYRNYGEHFFLFDTLDGQGCVFGEVAYLRKAQDYINYCIRITKAARFIVLTHQNIQNFRAKFPEFEEDFLKHQSKIKAQPFPILDCKIKRKLINELGNPIQFNAKKTLSNAFNKIYQILRSKRSREVDSKQLLKYLKQLQKTEASTRDAHASELLAEISNQVQSKCEKLLCDPVDRLLTFHERAIFKVSLMASLTHKILTARQKKKSIKLKSIKDEISDSASDISDELRKSKEATPKITLNVIKKLEIVSFEEKKEQVDSILELNKQQEQKFEQQFDGENVDNMQQISGFAELKFDQIEQTSGFAEKKFDQMLQTSGFAEQKFDQKEKTFEFAQKEFDQIEQISGFTEKKFYQIEQTSGFASGQIQREEKLKQEFDQNFQEQIHGSRWHEDSSHYSLKFSQYSLPQIKLPDEENELSLLEQWRNYGSKNNVIDDNRLLDFQKKSRNYKQDLDFSTIVSEVLQHQEFSELESEIDITQH